EYLGHFDVVQRLAEHHIAVADYLLSISQLMRINPSLALAEISSDWPTADQLRALISELTNAESQLSRSWTDLPEKYRNAMPHPTAANADVGRMTVGDKKAAYRAVWRRH